MPIYDYRCSTCKLEFTNLSSIKDMNIPTETPCSSCGSSNVKQFLPSAPIIGYNRTPSNYKMSNNFKDRMNEVAKNRGAGCTIKDAL